MKEIKNSGLPVWLDEETFKLSFKNGLTCSGDGGKDTHQLKGLLFDEEDLKEDEHCYDFYRDIVFEEHRNLFSKYDFRYDITVIMPGTVNGECKKTSGHYHGYIKGSNYTYPEVYEVLSGEAIYILQKVRNFDKPEEEPEIECIKAVRVKAGQAIIIPPFWGHCSINAGEGPMIFSNIAVVSCPLHYDPIRKKHGLGAYVVRKQDEIKIIKNHHYNHVPNIKVVTSKQNPELGITFGKPVYNAFINAPDKFDFLLHPEKYMDEMENMLMIYNKNIDIERK